MRFLARQSSKKGHDSRFSLFSWHPSVNSPECAYHKINGIAKASNKRLSIQRLDPDESDIRDKKKRKKNKKNQRKREREKKKEKKRKRKLEFTAVKEKREKKRRRKKGDKC